MCALGVCVCAVAAFAHSYACMCVHFFCKCVCARVCLNGCVCVFCARLWMSTVARMCMCSCGPVYMQMFTCVYVSTRVHAYTCEYVCVPV